MEKSVIIGAGTYGQVYAEYLKDYYSIEGFIDDKELLQGKEINGIPVLGNCDYLFNHLPRNYSVFVPIGNNKLRVELMERLNEAGFTVPSFIHPDTHLAGNVKLGKGIYILPGTCIMPFTVLEDYVMISIGVNISHHALLGKGCFCSHGVNVGASTRISTYSFLGVNSTIMVGVTRIGTNCMVGAGAVVIRNTPDNSVVVGVPAKVIDYQTT